MFGRFGGELFSGSLGEYISGFAYTLAVCSRAARRVFFMSMVMVMGPTPPGTGVMAEATGSTEA